MADILLIHGSGHGAWCWRDVIPALTALGHRARAIDLPSHGADSTPAADVTLDAYARAILGALEGPTVLVGHSMAGYPMTAAAEIDPALISRLVYLCAHVPQDGRTLVEMRASAETQPLLPAMRPSGDGLTISFDLDQVGALFYHDCPPETVAYARERLCPQAIAPQTTAIAVTERSASLPRSYIRCDDDRAIPPAYQRRLTRNWPEGSVHALPGSHSPFFAMPDRLASLIDAIIQE